MLFLTVANTFFITIFIIIITFGSTLRINEKFSKSAPPLRGRIVGGEIAAETSAPWQVSIQNIYGSHFCGGAILSEQFVVTAASCVSGFQKNWIKVVAGANNLMDLVDMLDVTEIYVHCSFDKPLYHNDIALLKLNKQLVFNDKIKNITLPDEDELVEGELLTMTGWGNSNGNDSYPTTLKQLKVKYLSYEECCKSYGNSKDVDVGHLCTIPAVGEGACHGDTGGPLINSNVQLIGIGNWGVPCGRGFPDVFAKLFFHAEWIRTTINGCTKSKAVNKAVPY